MMSRLGTRLLIVALIPQSFVEPLIRIASRHVPVQRRECRRTADRLAHILRDTCRAPDHFFQWHLLQMYQMCVALQRCRPRATPCGVEWPEAIELANAQVLAGHRQRRRDLQRHFFTWA